MDLQTQVQINYIEFHKKANKNKIDPIAPQTFNHFGDSLLQQTIIAITWPAQIASPRIINNTSISIYNKEIKLIRNATLIYNPDSKQTHLDCSNNK